MNASSINGSSDSTYVVLINSIASFVFNYDEDVEFTLSADGTTPSIILVDSEDNQCQTILDVNPLNPCSSDCSLNITDIDLECFNNDTEDIFTDDYYQINIGVEVFNGVASEEVSVSIDNEAPIIFDIENIELILSADELSHTIIIQDLDSLSCADTIEIGPLFNCSSPCILTLDLFEFSCNDNNTSLDSTDDSIEISWQVSAIDGSANGMYQVIIDNVLFGVFAYGDIISEIFTDLNGNEIVIQFVDSEFESCMISESLVLESCSNDCEIEATIIDVLCFNNGTNNTDIDDQYSFTLLVNGINVSSNWHIQGQTDLYSYNTNVELGPFDIITGIQTITLIDSENNNCPFDIQITPPVTCSECTQTVEAGDSIEINCSMNLASLVGISSEPGMYSWTGPQGFITNDSIAESSVVGWHYFEAIYMDGCSAIDSVFIFSEEDIPFAIGGPDTLLTCLVESVILEGTFNMNGDFTVFWEDADGNVLSNEPNLEVDSSGFYYFFVMNNITGCLSIPDEVFVGLNIEEPDAFIFADPGNTLDCKVELITLSFSNEFNVIYQWTYENEISTDATFELDSAGIVILTAIDTITGCIAVDSILIDELEEFPIINISPVNEINCDNTMVSLDASTSIPSNSSTFLWTDINGDSISNQSIINVIDPGSYIVIVTDSISGCENQDTIEVSSNTEMPDLSGPEDIIFNCSDTQAELIATSTNQGTYNWIILEGEIQGPSNQNSVIAISAGTYVVEFTDANSFCVATDTVVIIEEFDELEILDWQKQNESCFNSNDGMLLIGDIEGGTEPYELTLNGESIEQEDIFNLGPGSYNLLIVDDEGCSLDTTFIVNPANEWTISQNQSIEIELGQSSELNVTTNIPEDQIDTIIWSPDFNLDCTNCLITGFIADEDIIYTITIIDINGCEISTSIEIRVIIDESINVYAPNVITNNDDGVNDNFTLFTNEELQISELAIYNRWGERVFFTENIPTNNPDLGWDGTFKGDKVNPAVFAFYAILILPDGTEDTIVGDITVLK